MMLAASCADWNDHYEDSVAGGSDVTLWQQLEQRSELSDFREVLQNTKVFRHHKKTSVSYAELLNQGQSFTVMAPVNGTFDKDQLIAQTATDQGDSIVEKFFVGNHIARSANSVKEGTQQVTLLNTKHIDMGNDEIEGVSVKEKNVHAKNGVLHVLSAQVPYRYSLYEAMTDISDFSSIGSFIRQYDEDYFDENSSVSSGIVEGVTVYVDSVIIERNRLLEKIGQLAHEDSVYWMVAPSANGWNKAYEEAQKYFVYDAKVDKRDSIQRYWTNRALLDDAIYSMTLQDSPADSLVSVQYNRSEPKYHVFYKPTQGGILSNVEKTIDCSNGLLYQTAEWPFTPEQTYFQELRSEAEDVSLLVGTPTGCSYNRRNIAGDSISKGAYLDIVAANQSTNWDITYRVNNTLSGKYDVCAVILPKSVNDPDNPDLRPNKFKATISYVDTLGATKTFNCGNTQFKTDPLRVDTIVLAKGFQFPACNFDMDAIKITVKLTCSILARENSSYNREMYLDCIYLRPVREE